MDLKELKESVDFDFFDDRPQNGDNLSKSDSRKVTSKSYTLGSHDNIIIQNENNGKPNVNVKNKRSHISANNSSKYRDSGSYRNASASDSESDDDNKREKKLKNDRQESARSVSSTSTVSQLSLKIPTAGTRHESDSHSQSDDEENDKSDLRPGEKHRNSWVTNSTKTNGNNSRQDLMDEGDVPSSNTDRKARVKSARVTNNNLSSSDDEDLSEKSSSSSRTSSPQSSSSTYDSEPDSDSDVTDVSPLHSPEIPKSPHEGKISSPNVRLNSESRSRKKDGVRFEENITPGQSIHGRRMQERETDAKELSMLLRAVLELDEAPSKYKLNSLQRKLRPLSGRSGSSTQSSQSRREKGGHMPHHRMNLSFSNDEVKRIDRDNQRLLRNIIATKPSTPAVSGQSRRSRSERQVTSHSAVRRQRDQRRIELENMKILERIESAKPSSTVQKDLLLKDHYKQVQYGNQVAKSPLRPSSSRRTGKAYAAKMAKASSMSSLSSDWSRITSATGSTRSRPSSGKMSMMEEPVRGRPKQAWDENWQSRP